MKRTLMLLLVLVLAVALPGAADDPHDDHAHGHSHGHGHGDGGQTLHEIMHGLGAHLLALTYALLHDDAVAMSRSAEAIANHPPISREELERIAETLGDDTAEFERLDEALHHAAARLRDAAKSGDIDDVLTRLHETQRTCVACHTQFRERLADGIH